MTESSIHQPTPNASRHARTPSGSSSNRLLASHHSVFDLLHQKQHQQSATSNQNTRYSPVPNFDIHLSTVPSWQSISDYLTPRPTSSVLSNSDTEDDYYTRHIRQNDVTNSTVHVSNTKLLNSSYTDDENYEEDDEGEGEDGEDDDDEDDDKNTIEINMNQGRTSRTPLTATAPFTGSVKSNSKGSSFIMPEFSTDNLFDNLNNEYEDDAKILIIGHKKSNFFKMLNKPLSYRFTLNVQESYNIILIIFDGLIKIGNILNFIKQNEGLLQDKLFIPIFKNINQLVINKIIKTYRLNLLCPPINYNNKNQIENLLELLNQDFLLKESFYSSKALTYEDLTAKEDSVPQHEYQLVTIRGTSNSQVFSESIPPSSSVLINHDSVGTKGSISLNQLILKSDSQTRKQKYKKQKKSTMVFLTVTLSLGIGIGVTTAYALSYVFTPFSVTEKEIVNSLPITGTESTSILKKGFELTKGNIVLFKQSVLDVSKLVWLETKNGLGSVIQKWDKWIINYGKDATYSLLWLF